MILTKNICRDLLKIKFSQVKVVQKNLDSKKIYLPSDVKKKDFRSLKSEFLNEDFLIQNFFMPKELNNIVDKKIFYEILKNKTNLFFKLEKERWLKKALINTKTLDQQKLNTQFYKIKIANTILRKYKKYMFLKFIKNLKEENHYNKRSLNCFLTTINNKTNDLIFTGPFNLKLKCSFNNVLRTKKLLNKILIVRPLKIFKIKNIDLNKQSFDLEILN